MTDDPRVEALLEELLDSGGTPEEVCRACPELVPQVRAGWRRLRVLQANIGELFPESTPGDFNTPLADATSPLAGDMPRIPGYHVQRVLGVGGMGVVYQAWHLRLNRPVALKMLLAGAYAQPEELKRFLREAEAVAGLHHASIVQVYEVGDLDRRPYFTMEFVEGGSLARKLTGTPWPAAPAATLVATLALAIQAAHQRGVIHRDLKPSNILLAEDGTPKITDFGLAKRLDGDGDLTQSGVPIGTPSYMSPEQAKGQVHAIGPTADVYSLGAILYELLTGRPPFRGTTSAETVRQVIDQEPVPPSRLNPETPRDLETICLKCLQKAPQQRYATARALADDLGRCQRGEPITARPVSKVERVARWVRRKPTATALIVTALALTGFAVATGASQWRLEAKRRAVAAEWTPRLELVQQLLREGQFPQARALLQRAPEVEIGDLNAQIASALAELDLAQELNRIRLNRIAVVKGRFDPDANRARSDGEYETAFAEANVGGFRDAPAVVAARVSASPIRAVLVAALDDWAASTNDERRSRWIMDVARRADPDPSGWRDSVRVPALSREALAGLAQTAVVPEQSVQLLVALAQRMQAAGGDPVAFLGRVQLQYPGDFWACFMLADALWGKRLAECIRYYQAALAIRPDTAVAHLNVGRALANAERVDEAIEHFREAIRLEPVYAHAISNLGMALSIKGQGAEALELVQKAVVLDERTAGNHDRLGYVLEHMGQTEKAIEAFRRAFGIEPRLVIARQHLASSLRRLGRFDEAVEELQVAQRIDPTSAWPHFEMGRLQKARGKIDEAIAELEVAAHLNPRDALLHSLLGDYWREKQSPQKALFEYDRAIALRPDDAATIRARRAVVLQLGLGEAACVEWENALKARPPTHDAWYGYAELCLYLGHQDKYERACHDLLGQFESSDDPRVCEQVGRACLLGIVGQEDMVRAAALVERAVRADPLRSPAWAHPYFLIAQGLARYRLDDFDGAVRAVHGEALRAHGPLPHLVVAMAHRRAGRTGEAFRSFARALTGYDWSPSRVDSHDAWLYHTLRREAEPLVMPNLADLLAGRAEPHDSLERLALGAVYESRRQFARAAKMLAGAFDADPDLASRIDADHRYYAARCAARAGCGDGEDAAQAGDEDRAAWREHARTWLRDLLAVKRALLAGALTAERAALPGQLEIWLTDPALAGVRDDDALRKLSASECEAWRTLWGDVHSLLTQARSATSKTSR
jgi:serine/threonine-protein kinase